MGEIGRLITAMVTPLHEDGSVDYGQAKALARALLDSGSDGLVISGTTGESPTLTKDEKLRLFAEVKEVAGDHAIIAGTGTNNTAASIDLTQAAEGQGVDGALLVVPYYNKPTQEGLYRHFSAIAASTRLLCMLYNVPGRTVTNLSSETVLRLSGIPNIVGVKEGSGDLDQIGAIVDGVNRPDFHVWSGDDKDNFAIMRRGGYGAVSVASHLAGRQIQEMFQLCIAGRYKEAEAIQNRLAPLIRDLFVITSPIPVKHALNYIGFPVGGCRLPLTEADEKSAAIVEQTVRETTVDLSLPSATSPARR